VLCPLCNPLFTELLLPSYASKSGIDQVVCNDYNADIIIACFQVCACSLLGVSIWMAVSRNFMTIIIGNNLYAASVFIVLSCGGILFFVTFLGCCGVVKEQRFMLFVVSLLVWQYCYFYFFCIYLMLVNCQLAEKCMYAIGFASKLALCSKLYCGFYIITLYSQRENYNKNIISLLLKPLPWLTV